MNMLVVPAAYTDNAKDSTDRIHKMHIFSSNPCGYLWVCNKAIEKYGEITSQS